MGGVTGVAQLTVRFSCGGLVGSLCVKHCAQNYLPLGAKEKEKGRKRFHLK